MYWIIILILLIIIYHNYEEYLSVSPYSGYNYDYSFKYKN